MSGSLRFLTLVLAVASTARGGGGQQRPDSARADSLRRVQALPTIETRARRDEQVAFETQPNVGMVSLTASELTSAPRFFGEADVLRAVRLLPGVNARNDYSVGMNVRGGEADQNLVLLDGYPIYNPFHMGGLFGAFVEPMVSRVTFLTGGFPAAYGGRLSSVLDVRSAEEPRGDMHGRADVSFIASTVAVGQGMQQGRGTWVVAARRTYADKVADVVSKGSVPYHFRDAQAHVVRVLPGDVKLSVTAYDNVDHMLTNSDADAFYIDWSNRLLGATAERTFAALGDSARVEQRFSLSKFNMGMDLIGGALTLNNRVRDLRAAGSLTSFSSSRRRTIGYEVSDQRYAFDANYPLLLYPSDVIANDNRSAGVYLDQLWRPARRWLVQAGARVDAVTHAGWALQPRLSAKYFVTPVFALTAAAGEFAQWSHTLSREDVPIRALDFWVGSDANIPMSRARHFVLGVERWVTPTRAFRVESWFKDYPSLVEQNPRSDLHMQGDEYLRLTGRSFGADVMLRQLEQGRHSGWLAYSFSYSRRRSESGERFFPGQDRRHELNVVWNRRSARYLLSTRFNLATGTPHTPVFGAFTRQEYNPVLQQFDHVDYLQFRSGARNAARLPLASRVDVSLTRRGRVRGASVSPFLSVMNVYNARNVFAYLYDYANTPPKRIGLQQFPIFPTLGVTVVW